MWKASRRRLFSRSECLEKAALTGQTWAEAKVKARFPEAAVAMPTDVSSSCLTRGWSVGVRITQMRSRIVQDSWK